MSVYCNCCGKEHWEDDARLCGKCSSDTPLADEVRKLTNVHWDGDYRQDEIRELADRVAAKERELAEARAEIARLKRPIRCHDVDEFYREDAAPGGEVKGE